MEPRMAASGQRGPVVVCLEGEDNPAPLVRCGAAMALVSNAGLYLAAVLVLPAQRSLDLSAGEEQEAETMLEAAADLATESGVAPEVGIWVARSWKEAIQQIVDELSASALVIGWRARGPLHLLDIGRTLLKAVPCPVIMVGQARGGNEQAAWPPRWLLKAQLQLSD